MSKKERKKSPRQFLKSGNSFIQYSSMAIKMVVVILLFSFGGKQLDTYLASNSAIGTMIFTVVGVAVSMYIVIKDLLNK